MRTVPLGSLRVSELCLGCMFFGTLVDERASFEVLDRYFEAGGRFLDTADNYAFWTNGGRGGESEALLGRWLRSRGVRDEVVLATKCGARPLRDGDGLEAAEGLSAAAVRTAVEGSLERLGTDHADLVYAHVDDRATPLEETVAAFGALVRDGLTRETGCSNHHAWRIERARRLAADAGTAPYAAVQQRLSYLRPRPDADLGVQVVAGDELLDFCATEDVTLLAYSVLLSGAYQRSDRPIPEGYRGPDTDARLAALREVADETGASANQVVLAWLRGGVPPVLPLIAASSVAQLDESLGALDVELDGAQRARLDAAGA